MNLSIALASVFAIVGTSGFTSQSQGRTSTSLHATFPPATEWKSYYTNSYGASIVETDADKGFDPLGFSKSNGGSLFFMREAEIKHCRLAMLAAASWPMAELLDKPLANLIGQQPFVDAMDRNP